MNIHPLIVHFPIALLTVYTLAEVARFGFVRRHPAWFTVKAVLLIVGSLGSFAAMGSGLIAAQIFGNEDVVFVHKSLAVSTASVYFLLALSYLIQWLDRNGRMWPGLARFERAVFRAPVTIILALIGMVLLTMTGAMGGALVYGPEMDPIVSFVYHLFFPE